MENQTLNYGFNKDTPTDYYNINKVNDNLDLIDSTIKGVDDKVMANKFKTAGGTATAITLTDLVFADGNSKTFIVKANNNGSATTINGKHLYKPGTIQAPKLSAGKAVTVWYSSSGDCFFIKASAEGNALAEHVLEPFEFSNGDDTGIPGTMPNNGPATAQTINLTDQNAEYTIPLGYHTGLRKIKAVITGLIASVIKAGTTVGGILGTFTSDATATDPEVLSGKTYYKNGEKRTGSMTNRNTDQIATAISQSGTTLGLRAPAGYYDGTRNINRTDANFLAENIRQGVPLFGKVGSLIPGLQFASGTAQASPSPQNYTAIDNSSISKYPLTVSGLTFKPKYILAITTTKFNNYSIGTMFIMYIENGEAYNAGGVVIVGAYSGMGQTIKADVAPVSITTTGFSIPADNHAVTFKWYAIG